MNRLAPTRRLQALLAGLTLLACAVAALALPTAAMASKCGDQVLQDWSDNGRIDRVYPQSCYIDAIDSIPADLLDYANVEDVISRALAAVQTGSDDTDGSGDRPVGVPGEEPGENGSSEVTPGTDSASSSDPSSVPIPLLLLGAMSLALLGAGGLGYLSRRRNAADDGLVDDDLQP